jgi:preprotein translocase subunit SecD
MYMPTWKVLLVLGATLAGILLTAPNFLGRDTAASLPKWLPHQQVNLGLDLRGGSHLLLEVDIAKVLAERLEALVEGARSELRTARIGYSGLGVRPGNTVSLKLREAAQVPQAVEALRKLAVPVSRSGLGLGLGGGVPDMTVSSEADGTITMRLSQEALVERASNAVQQSIEIVRRRIDETGVNEPTIQRQGSDRILVQLPGVGDPDRVKRLLGKTAKMVFRMVDVSPEASETNVPPGSELLEADDERDPTGRPRKWVVRKKVEVAGDNLIDAQPTYDQRNGQPVVNFRFDAVGAKRFAEVTKENVGRPFAIVLDDRVISAPVIREPILAGSGQISGNFTVQSANDLAVLLRAGALPAPLKILEERTVGPDLGADSIAAGRNATVIGFVLVMAYMVAGYGVFGIFANMALIANVFMLIGALSILQATLTLPGIAGILLTLGMAVDANVLINERIREETRIGKSPLAAMEAGFGRAFATILDSNLTTLLAMVILYALGSGPVRGFAVTISLGIATSMFTAILLARLLMMTWWRRRRPAALPV